MLLYRNLSTVGLPLSGRPSELIELALSFGFDGMEIDILDFCQQADIYGVAHARRLMVSARLKAASFRLPVALAGDEEAFQADLAALPKRLEMAAATECPRALATLEPGSNDHEFKDFFEQYRTRLHTIGDLLEQHGIMLGLAIRPEAAARADLAHGFIQTYEGLVGLLAASHPRVGAIVDAFSLRITGESPEILQQIPRGRIVEVRLSDAPHDPPPAELTKEQRLLVGETGVIGAAKILQAAEAAGFDGPVTPWADRSTIAGRGRERIVRIAGDRMEAVWREAGLPIVPRWFTPVSREDGAEVEAALAVAEETEEGQTAEPGSRPAAAGR
jgi:sugar phosphate isomerase/epimerase